jgi:WD40 repeat protein
MYHKQAIESYPLQAYRSALVFSPKKSLIRHAFQHENKERIEVRPMIDDWGLCLRTLEGHSESVLSVAVSGDSRWVVTGSGDNTAKIWDAGSGHCVHTLEGHSGTALCTFGFRFLHVYRLFQAPPR